jgi:tRNA(Ile)-lysidine synthase
MGGSMYHVFVSELAKRLLAHIRREELLQPGERVGVAVSGGIDSVALLRLLIELRQELGIVLAVVHFNHKLRGAEAEADQRFVAGLAREHGLEFYCSSGDVAGLAAERHSGIEAAAREMRYEFFRWLLDSERQGLKPKSIDGRVRGSKAPLFHGDFDGASEVAPFQNPPPAAERSSHDNSDGIGEIPRFARDGNGERGSATSKSVLEKIATGHTLDDQAETVLMRLIRGTGLRGLGGIYPRVLVEDEDGDQCGEILRPLLGIRRRELEKYLRDVRQPWREDASNTDAKFTRNRVRGLVLPLLEREFNPAIVENLSELAEIARDEEDYWENEAAGWFGTVVQQAEPGATSQLVQILPVVPGAWAGTPDDNWKGVTETEVPRFARDDSSENFEHDNGGSARSNNEVRNANLSLSRPWLLTEPRAVQRRVLKAIGEEAGIPLEFKHVEEILRFADEDGPTGKELSLPLGWKTVREAEAMIFLAPDVRRPEQIPDYEYSLPVPGRVAVPEVGVMIEALLVTRSKSNFDSESDSVSYDAEYNPQQLLRADLLRGLLTVRNWRAGDRFWPAHTKSPKKIKELLQERHVTQSERRLWPVAVRGDEIVWMRGFAVPAKLRAEPGQEAVLIQEVPLAG